MPPCIPGGHGCQSLSYTGLQDFGKSRDHAGRKSFYPGGYAGWFEENRDNFAATLILEDYIHIAKDGDKIDIEVSLENFPAVENFANYSEKRMFFAANFHVNYLGETHICHRCFSCFAMDREGQEVQTARELANRRLVSVYREFDKAGIQYNRILFE